jgi:hypothetical protein
MDMLQHHTNIRLQIPRLGSEGLHSPFDPQNYTFFSSFQNFRLHHLFHF